MSECCSIAGRLRDSHTDMWPCDEGGIAEQHHSAARHVLALQVKNGLDKWLFRPGNNFSELRREKTLGILA